MSCFSGDGIEHEVEGTFQRRHRLLVAGQHACRTKAIRVGGFALRSGEYGHVGAHGLRELDGHVAEAAESDDADLVTRFHLPVLHGGERRHPGA